MNPFDAMYEGTPPWEIGRPQEPFVRLLAEGQIQGRVLDVGCGTGDTTLHFAAHGREAWGIDASRRAILRAKGKAGERGLRAQFLQGNVFELQRLRTAFDTIVDCGLFHTFTDEARVLYLRNLEHVLRRGGTLHLLCFSDREPDWGGPRRVREAELRATFGGGWWVESVTPARFVSRMSTEGARAHLLTATWEGRPLPGIH